MKKLREQLAVMSALVQTENALAAEEKKASNEIEEAVKHGHYTSDAHMQKLSQAQLRKTLIPARRRKLAKQIAESEAGFRDTYAQARQGWDSFVEDRKQEVFERLLKALEPFFGGPEKAVQTRREFEAMHVPARDAINRAFSPDFFKAEVNYEDIITWAQFLLAHADKYSKQFGWGDTERATAPRKVPQSRFFASETNLLKVRASQTVSLPALGTRSGANGKPTSTVQKGSVLEISERDYHALSRFFEPI